MEEPDRPAGASHPNQNTTEKSRINTREIHIGGSGLRHEGGDMTATPSDPHRRDPSAEGSAVPDGGFKSSADGLDSPALFTEPESLGLPAVFTLGSKEALHG